MTWIVLGILVAVACSLFAVTAGATQRAWEDLVGPEQTADVTAGTVTYFDFGKGDAQMLILLNGIGTTKTQWDTAFLRDLARCYRLITLDYPGIGTATIRDYNGFTIPNIAQAVVELSDHLKIDRPNLLGFAFSGKVAGLLVAEHSDRFGKYVNVAGRIANVSGKTLSEADLTALTNEREWKVAARAWPKTFPGFSNALAVGLRAYAHAQEPRTPEALAAYRSAQRQWQEAGDALDLAKISNPTLIIAGDIDDVAPLADMQAAADAIAANGAPVTFRHYPGASHTVIYQNRRQVVQDIRAFLE